MWWLILQTATAKVSGNYCKASYDLQITQDPKALDSILTNIQASRYTRQ